MIFMTWPQARFEVRRIPVTHFVKGQDRVIPVWFTADIDCPEGKFWCSVANTIYLSLDDGATYTLAGITKDAAVDIGAFTKGQIKQAKIKISTSDTFHIRVVIPYIGSGA